MCGLLEPLQVIGPTQQYRVGPNGADAVALQQCFGARKQVFFGDDRGERFELVLLDELPQAALMTFTQLRAIFHSAARHVRERQQAASRGQPIAILGQVMAIPDAAAQCQDRGTPVLGVIDLLFQPQ
jgi:hypothetical protein